MKKIRFGIEIGKEAREIDISLRDWQRIQKGEKVSLSMLNYYEADDRWGFEPYNSYLYDSLVLHRQLIYNSWAEPLKKMKKNIQNMCDK